MELLIPGLILVALMVYASTRIKRTVAEAFEPETVETDHFTFEKPEGFLTVLNGDPGLAYEGYSKVFGGEGAEDIRQARVEVASFAGMSLEQRIAEIAEAARITSKTNEIINEQKYMLVEAERTEKNNGFVDLHKLAMIGSDVIELKIMALTEIDPDIARKIDTIVLSFSLK